MNTYRLNGLPVYVVTFSEFVYLLDVQKIGKRLLARKLNTPSIVDHITKTRNGRDFYIEYNGIIIDMRYI